MPDLAPRLPGFLPSQRCQQAAKHATASGHSPEPQPGPVLAGVFTGVLDCGTGVCSLCRGETIADSNVVTSALGLCCLQLS